MKEIPLSSRKWPRLVALVDDEDFEWLSQFKWHPRAPDLKTGNHSFYACTSARGQAESGSGSRKMHRFIVQGTGDVDHINGDGLDNRRSNLRTCSSSQNSANSRKSVHLKSSRYKGVSLRKREKKWVARIRKSGVLIHLGRFTEEISAALAYNAKALELFGEFAKLNIIDPQEVSSCQLTLQNAIDPSSIAMTELDQSEPQLEISTSVDTSSSEF